VVFRLLSNKSSIESVNASSAIDFRWNTCFTVSCRKCLSADYTQSHLYSAEPLLFDLIQWNSYENEQVAYVEKKHPLFDRLLTHVEEEKKQLVASKDDIVLYIRYYGNADMDIIVENAAQKIQKLADS